MKTQIDNSYQVAYITKQAAKGEPQQVGLEQGVRMELALGMQEPHALERESAEIAGAILRNSWPRCETRCAKISGNGCRPIGSIDHNAPKTQAWSSVSQSELGTSTLSCCVLEQDIPKLHANK